MKSEKVFSVADIAKKIEIPRTTLNEWLNRYPQFIESRTRGKRKVYTEKAVETLREIAALRDYGRSAVEIEQELALKHPFQAEVQADTEQKASAKPEKNINALMMAPRQLRDELALQINDEVGALASSLQQNLHDARRTANRSFRWQIILIVLVVLLGAIFLLFAVQIAGRIYAQQQQLNNNNVHLDTLRGNTEELTLELKKREIQIVKQEKVLQDMSVTLDKNSKDYQQNIALLERELATMAQKFEESLKRESKKSSGEQNLSMDKMRNEFAQKQLDVLKKIEEYSKRNDLKIKEDIESAAQTAAKIAAEAVVKAIPIPAPAPAPAPVSVNNDVPNATLTPITEVLDEN